MLNLKKEKTKTKAIHLKRFAPTNIKVLPLRCSIIQLHHVDARA